MKKRRIASSRWDKRESDLLHIFICVCVCVS